MLVALFEGDEKYRDSDVERRGFAKHQLQNLAFLYKDPECKV